MASRPRITSAEASLRPTRAEIDLDALAHNLHQVEASVGAARVLCIVKADGYGHGVVPVAQRLEQEGAGGFGVALAEEGLELRDAGIAGDILVLNGVYGGAFGDVLDRKLLPVVYDLADVAAFHAAAGGLPFRVHLKVDTGMSRLGVPWARLPQFLAGLTRFPGLVLDGVMTHFASAESDDAFTREQLGRFEEALRCVRAHGHAPRLVHAANSAGALRFAEARYDAVRPGVLLFGVQAAPDARLDLRPVMRLRTEVIALRDLEPGASVGYSGGFVAQRPTRIATVPVGYGDGLMRSVGNRGCMLVRGRRCPIVGHVSMDLTTLDVTDAPDVSVGDEALILGQQGSEAIDAAELGRAAGTIPYEILTNVSRRVPRFYREPSRAE